MCIKSNSVWLVYSLVCFATLIGQDARAQKDNKTPPVADKTEGAKPNFDKVGPQVGDQVPDLNLRTIKGEPQRLGDAWRGGPALLVTSSLTCPKSRSRWPELKKIVEDNGDKLNVVIVYVIEAHPVGSICPYKGVEDITPENERDGILRRQPATLEDRLELAQEFKRYVRVSTPIYVDTVNNQAWKAIGAAPNIAFLVDEKGIVVARQSWFEGPAMQAAIDKHLVSSRNSAPDEQRPAQEQFDEEQESAKEALLRKAGLKSPHDLSDAITDETTDKLSQILKRSRGLANYVFPSRQGHARETTSLMEAVYGRKLAAAELLLTHGADIKAQTRSFDSALQIAAQNGDVKMTNLLLRHRADPSFPSTGQTPLHEAALVGNQDVAKLLIAAGAKTDLYSDIALGNLSAVKLALNADPSLALRPDGAGRMPLDYAAASDQLEVAKLLLASGAPVVDYLRSSSDSPLHRAIRRTNAPLVKLLLEAGSSPNTAVGHSGEDSSWTPALHTAVRGGSVEIVELLLSHKVDLVARNTYSKTALHSAASEGRAEIAAILIRAGADVNALQLGFSLPCGSGEEEKAQHNTPLHFAAARGNPETIKVLLAGGAKLEAQNRHGVTPLLATIKPPIYTGIAEESQLKNVETLIAAGAELNARNKRGESILDLATAKLTAVQSREGTEVEVQRLESLVALLKKHGAKPGEKSSKARVDDDE